MKKTFFFLVCATLLCGYTTLVAQLNNSFKKPIQLRKILIDNLDKTPEEIKTGKQLPVVKSESSTWKIRNKSRAIPYVPFTLQEISPDKPITENDTIIVEKNDDDGSDIAISVRAGDYLQEMNAIERQMNSWGKTQRKEEDELSSGINLDEQKLETQKRSMPSTGLFKKTREIENDFSKSSIVNGSVIKSFTKTSPQEFEKSKSTDAPASGFQRLIPSDSAVQATKSRSQVSQGVRSRMDGAGIGQTPTALAPDKSDRPPLLLIAFNHPAKKKWELGDKSTFYLGLNAEATLTGAVFKTLDTLAKLPHDQALAIYKKSATYFDINAQAKAEAFILSDLHVPLLDASLKVHAPVHQDSSATLSTQIDLFGVTVYNPATKQYKEFLDSATKSKEFRKSKTISFNLVVPVDVEVGVAGKIGLKYFAKSDKSSLDAYATPFADVTGFAKCSVNLFIVRAGVEGNLTFLKGEMNLSGHADLLYGNKEFIFNRDFQCNYNLNMLSGNIKAFAERRNWRFKWKRFWSHELFSWSGVTISGDFGSNVTERKSFAW